MQTESDQWVEQPFKDGPKMCSVVGLAVRYPGSCNAEGFWQTAVGAGDVQSVVPHSRWAIDSHYAPDTKAGKLLSSTR